MENQNAAQPGPSAASIGSLPPYPPLPPGFSRWVYRGVMWASGRAVVVTSFDVTQDIEWDPVAVFETEGQENTHYIEAVIDHDWICKCAECRPVPATDANVVSVRRKMLIRAERGLAKYGVTTERNDLDTLQWLQHAQDEAMDLAVYLERLMADLRRKMEASVNEKGQR